MADLARPALPEVLAALTERDDLPEWQHEAHRAVVRTKGVAIRWVDPFQAQDARAYEWTTTDPTEAAELLVTREVLPAGWHGDTRRGWACPGCGGRGEVTAQTAGGLVEYGCPRCSVDPDAHGTGLIAHPRTIPDLVAVASLGWPAIQRAEELAPAACHALREYGCPTPDRVVWRVGDRGPAHREVYARDVGYPGGIMLCANGSCIAEAPAGNVCSIDARAARELWTMGLALDAITPDAVVVVVPPVGGAS